VGRGAPVLGEPNKMLFYKDGDLGLQRDLVGPARCAPSYQRLDEEILGLLAVLIMLIGRPAAFDNPGHAIGVAESRARQPHSPAEVLAGDLAVLPDPQRRPTRHAGLRTSRHRYRDAVSVPRLSGA
jgi:hypothetical protein